MHNLCFIIARNDEPENKNSTNPETPNCIKINTLTCIFLIRDYEFSNEPRKPPRSDRNSPTINPNFYIKPGAAALLAKIFLSSVSRLPTK